MPFPAPQPDYWQKVADEARKASQNNARLAGQRAIEIERLTIQLRIAKGQLDHIVDLVNEGRRAEPADQAAYLERIAAALGLSRYVPPQG